MQIPQWVIRRATCSVLDRLEIVYMNDSWHIVTAQGMHYEEHSSFT